MSADESPLRAEDPAEAPEGVPKKDPAKFEPPVAWLFGRQFIATLKWVLLYTAFKGKLDARDWMQANLIPDPQADVDDYWRRRRRGEPQGAAAPADAAAEEFWFDYISDTGDGQKAVYSIAYLCMSDLAAGRDPQLDERLEYVPDPDAVRAQGDRLLLPRGSFLFVGGDTSYHISDYATIAVRFQNPFCWAYRDLYRSGAASVLGKLPRLLLGIPGNHDYYDSLDGFNRQFRRPAAGEERADGGRVAAAGVRRPQLRIPTFERAQQASYVALRLPFDWWFWGLDTEGGEIDFRQWEFFDGIRERHRPRKLIVATPEPTTAFGKYARADESQSKTFAALGLERPFLKDAEPMGAGKCRVDLSGDIHHYARHWGGPPRSPEPANYTSVMAGGGGAFFHPSHTTVKEIKPEKLYPEERVSRERVTKELFKFTNIVRGGYVWLFGFIIAFAVAFAANFPPSSREAIDAFPPLVGLGLSSAPAAAPAPPARDFYLRLVPLFASLALLAGALFYSSKLFAKKYDPQAWLRDEEQDKEKDRPMRRVLLWVLVAASFAALVYGFRGLRGDVGNALLAGWGFRRSVVILFGLAWAALALVQSVKYSEWLFEEARKENIKPWHYWPIWGLVILSVLGLGSALWFFGRQESALMVSDILFLLVVALVVGGLAFFAVSTGAGLKKGVGKIGFLLLGLSHGLLQLAVPFLLMRRGHLLWATAATAVLVFLSSYVGRALARLENGWPLALAWVALGAALLVIPFYLPDTLEPWLFDGAAPLNTPAGGWGRLALCLYAGAVGALMSCVLFGWYLAVSLAFNGHNNESGGAARIEGFKQFIRFRINRDGLTGYVIAFDEPSTEGGAVTKDGGAVKLVPKIVDVFRVCDR